MNKIRFIRCIAALTLAFVLSSCMVACGKDKKDKKAETNDEGIDVKVADVDEKDINDGWSPIWKP